MRAAPAAPDAGPRAAPDAGSLAGHDVGRRRHPRRRRLRAHRSGLRVRRGRALALVRDRRAGGRTHGYSYARLARRRPKDSPEFQYTAGVRTAGRVRGRLVDARAVPATATWAALALTTLVVAGGDLVQAAALTDAAVLGSFGLVNASLLGCRGSRSPLAGASAGSTS